MTPKPTTIAAMARLARPDGLAGDLSTPMYQVRRIAPFETQVWRLDATIKSVVLREDGDFYLVVQDASGARAVVEVPDPAKCKGSALEPRIAATRRVLEARFHPGKAPKDADAKATFEGVGFFGFAKKGGQGAKNGARLMPGTGVTLR